MVRVERSFLCGRRSSLVRAGSAVTGKQFPKESVEFDAYLWAPERMNKLDIRRWRYIIADTSEWIGFSVEFVIVHDVTDTVVNGTLKVLRFLMKVETQTHALNA